MWKGYNTKFTVLIQVDKSLTEGDFTIAEPLLLCSQQCGLAEAFQGM